MCFGSVVCRFRLVSSVLSHISFDAARNRARPCRGITKVTTSIMVTIGTVKFFNATKGFGFIQPDNGNKDVFVHISAVEAAGLGMLQENQKISFEIETGRNGKISATNLKAA